MDRNAAIGFVLIALIFIAYIYLNTPSPEEEARMRKQRDSIAFVQKQQYLADSIGAIQPDSSVIAPAGSVASKTAQQGIFTDTSIA